MCTSHQEVCEGSDGSRGRAKPSPGALSVDLDGAWGVRRPVRAPPVGPGGRPRLDRPGPYGPPRGRGGGVRGPAVAAYRSRPPSRSVPFSPSCWSSPSPPSPPGPRWGGRARSRSAGRGRRPNSPPFSCSSAGWSAPRHRFPGSWRWCSAWRCGPPTADRRITGNRSRPRAAVPIGAGGGGGPGPRAVRPGRAAGDRTACGVGRVAVRPRSGPDGRPGRTVRPPCPARSWACRRAAPHP